MTATQAPTPGPLTFGAGKLVVDTGHYAGSPAVFICAAKVGGFVGASAQVENNPTDCLQPNETVLTFPTMEQAKSVADALVLAPTAPVEASGSEREAEVDAVVERLSKVARNCETEPEHALLSSREAKQHAQDLRSILMTCPDCGQKCIPGSTHNCPYRGRVTVPLGNPKQRVRSDDVVATFMALGRPSESLLAFHDLEPDEVLFYNSGVVVTVGAVRELQHFLSNTPAPVALGGQQGASDEIKAAYKRGWNDRESDIIERAEPIAPIDPARAEAQDEGAAGAVGRALYEAFWKRNGGNEPAWCDQSSAIRNMWDAIADDARAIRAHPSPTPTADADRVLQDLADRVTAEVKRGADGSHVQALGALSNIEGLVLAALKSTAAKEGGK